MKYDIQKRTKRLADQVEKDWEKISDFQYKGQNAAFSHALRENEEYKGEQLVGCFNIAGVPINFKYRELKNKKTGKKTNRVDVV